MKRSIKPPTTNPFGIFRLSATGTAGLLALAAMPSGARAQTTIVADNFGEYGTGEFNDGTWAGVTPDLADLPGGTWNQVNGFPWGMAKIEGYTDYENSFSEGIGNTQENGTGMAISIASSGSYVEPSQLAISADLAIEANGNTPSQNSMELGFYAAGTTFSGYNYQNQNFTGLSLDDAGDLSLLVNGSQVGVSVPFGGTFNPNALSTLSFDVDTTAGTISDIVFGDSTADYSGLESGSGLFSASNMAYAGNYAQGSQNDNGSATGNFAVTGVAAAVPEPATYVSLAGGMLALGAFQYRRRRNRFGA